MGYVRRNDHRQYHSNGSMKQGRSWTVEREFRDGISVIRLLERDGKPIPAEERQAEEDRIRKYIAEVKAMTPEQTARQKEERERNRRKESDEDEWIKEFPEALDYKPAGEEIIHGRPALVLAISPRPGYRPRNMRARVFEKVRGKVWIDKADTELVRADAEVFETVNIGLGIVGRVEKGTRFQLQRTKVESSWLPESQTIRFTARFLLFKSLNQESTTRYSNYRPREAFAASAR